MIGLVSLIGLTALSLFPLSAFAQIAPTGAHYGGRPSDTGVENAVNSQGAFSASVPLDLPPARSGLPVPLEVVYDGRSVGAAGLGWDVPLSYILRDTSIAHRRPSRDPDTGDTARELLTLVLDGHRMNLVRKGGATSMLWVPQFEGPQLEVHDQGNGVMVLYDGDGRTYTFNAQGGAAGSRLLNGNMYLLSSIAGQGNLLTLGYQMTAPVLADGTTGLAINLTRVSYNQTPTSGCPKNRINLNYSAAAASPLSMAVLQGQLMVRLNTLATVDVLSRSSCTDNDTRLRRYQFNYPNPDPDTGLPRLESVQVLGRQGTPEASKSITLAKYSYGTASSPDGVGGRKLHFQLTKTLPLPADSLTLPQAIAFTGRPSGSSTLPGTDTWQTMIDLTGDGRADWIYTRQDETNSNALTMKLVPNLPTPLDFTRGPIPLTHAVFGAEAKRPIESQRTAAARFSTTNRDYVWRQAIDFNGDGRVDIVDAREVPGKWVVYLNYPVGNSWDTHWERFELSVDLGLLQVLRGKGYTEIDGRSGYMPLASRVTGRHITRYHCMLYLGGPKNNEDSWTSDFVGTPPPECAAKEGQIDFGPEKTYTEWELKDLNGDGFPDVVFDSAPVVVSTNEFVGNRDALVDRASVVSYQDDLEPWLDRVEVMFNESGTQIVDLTSFHLSRPIQILDQSPCGVGAWVETQAQINRHTPDDHDVNQVCGFADVNGDGLVDRIEGTTAYLQTGGVTWDFGPAKVTLPGFMSVAYSDHNLACGALDASGHYRPFTNVNNEYSASIQAALRDMNGDGIPDYVSSSQIFFGTGTGFAPPIPHDLFGEFVPSLELEDCFGTRSRTLAGIFDFDGDGKGDLVNRLDDQGIRVFQMVSGAQAGTPEAGRLVGIENGQRAKLQITYGSAKEQAESVLASQPRAVPFPEIVVTATEMVDTTGGGGRTLLEKTQYAYSRPELMHDPRTDRFGFARYRRRVELRKTNGSAGMATIRDSYPLVDLDAGSTLTPPQRLLRNLIVGRPSDVTVLSGDLGTSAAALLNTDIATDQRVIATTHYTWDAQLFTESGADYDCVEMAAPIDWITSAFFIYSYNPCTAHGFAFQKSVDSRRNEAIFRGRFVHTHEDTLSVDTLGRIRKVLNLGDVLRGDDDLVTHLTYATPSDPAARPRVLNALQRRTVTNTAETVTYADETWERNTEGLPTQHTVSRISATGVLLGTVKEFDATYFDTTGNPRTVTMTREDGATRTVTFGDFDVFGMAPATLQTTTTGGPTSPAPQVIRIERDPLTSNVSGVTEANGTRTGLKYDGFDRARLTTVHPVSGGGGALSSTKYLGFADGEIGGQRIEQTLFTDPVDEASAANTPGRKSTVYLDNLGRRTFTLVDLGADYQNQRLLVGAREYDTLGRVVFEADPFTDSEVFSNAYGTSYYFNTDGTPLCTVRGYGPQSYIPMETEEAKERYVSCFNRSFSDGLEFLVSVGPDSYLPSSGQEGVSNHTVRDALGRVRERSTWLGTTRLELATFTYDALGHLSGITRYKDPATPASPVTTTWETNSVGQVLTLHEPESWTQFRHYSNWGELKEISFADTSASPPAERRAIHRYDALGRLVHSEETTNLALDPDSVLDYHYDQPVNPSPLVSATNVLGRLAEAVSPTGAVAFSYDALGRVNARVFTDDQGQTYVEKHAYHGDGTPDALHLLLPDNVTTGNERRDEHVSYTYDSAGRPKTVGYSDGVMSQNLFEATTVDVFGRVREAHYGATTYSATYAEVGRRLMSSMRISSTAAGSPSREISFPAAAGSPAFDPVGRERNRAEVKNGSATAIFAFAYDELGRLGQSTRIASGTTDTRSVQYDPLGNITFNGRVDLFSQDRADLAYGSADLDRVSSIGYELESARAVTYDGVGNVKTMPAPGGKTRTFDYFANGLVKHIGDGQGTADFRYDAFGAVQTLTIRSSTAENNRTDRRYGAMIAFRDELVNGVKTSVLTRSIPGPDGFLATRHGTTGPWIFGFGEARGTRFFTDENGNFVQDVDYTPFGRTSQPNASLAPQYSSQQWNGGDALEAFGLVQLGARLYDPKLGRFLSRDPLLIPRTAATTNPYAFAFNDPVNGSDPSGLDPELSIHKTYHPDPGTDDFRGLTIFLEDDLSSFLAEGDPSFPQISVQLLPSQLPPPFTGLLGFEPLQPNVVDPKAAERAREDAIWERRNYVGPVGMLFGLDCQWDGDCGLGRLLLAYGANLFFALDAMGEAVAATSLLEEQGLLLSTNGAGKLAGKLATNLAPEAARVEVADVLATEGLVGCNGALCAGSCFVAGTAVRTNEGTEGIDRLELGERVRTLGDDECSAVDWGELWYIRFESHDNAELVIEALRPLAWITSGGYREGKRVYLALPEIEFEGEVVVARVGAHKSVEARLGCPVLTKYSHLSNRVLSLRLASPGAPIGTTATHPFFSNDRGTWVQAGELRVGERVATLSGSTTVAGMEYTGRVERVFNLEVGLAHTYLVGESAAWVHNVGCSGAGWITPGKNFKDHYIRHKALLERALGQKLPKWSESADGLAFREGLEELIGNGQLQHQGLATINKGAVPAHVFEGRGITAVIRPNGEFVTLLESGTGRASAGAMQFSSPQQLLLPGFTPW